MDPPDEVGAARAPLTPPFATPANGSDAASEVYRESGRRQGAVLGRNLSNPFRSQFATFSTLTWSHY
jgi:hypothetical protein